MNWRQWFRVMWLMGCDLLTSCLLCACCCMWGWCHVPRADGESETAVVAGLSGEACCSGKLLAGRWDWWSEEHKHSSTPSQPIRARASENSIKMQCFTQMTSRRPAEQASVFARLSGTHLSSASAFPAQTGRPIRAEIWDPVSVEPVCSPLMNPDQLQMSN